MTTTVKGVDGTETDVDAEDGQIQVSAYAGDSAPATSAYHTPAQTRELAAVLLRAADEAEGREPAGALAHLMAVLDMQYDADEIAEEPSILTQIRADAERIVRMVRDEVAGELERMDGTNLGMSIGRTHAATVARRGLTPADTQHGS